MYRKVPDYFHFKPRFENIYSNKENQEGWKIKKSLFYTETDMFSLGPNFILELLEQK